MSDITVAIPIYNGARFLPDAIRSLLGQTFRDFRLLCIDDLSTDGSADVARSFNDDRLEVVVNDVRRGLPGNWNRAFELSSPGFLVIAHQDDVYEPEYLGRMIETLRRHPHAFISHCLATSVDEAGRARPSSSSQYKERFWPKGAEYESGGAGELRTLQAGNYIICPSVMYRMDAVRSLGTFDDRYSFVPDWEYWIRGVAKGFTIAGVRQHLMRWRRHGHTATVEQEKTLRRFDEELTLLTELSRNTSLPLRLDLVRNTLLSEFATRLAAGDRSAATAILDYVRRRLPDAHAVQSTMRASLACGRAAGVTLKMLESAYVPFARVRESRGG